MYTSPPSRRSWAIRSVKSLLQRQRHQRKRQSRGGSVEQLEDRALLATFTVTNVNDDGAGSLREAIDDANATAAADCITFEIPAIDPASLTITLTTGEYLIDEQLSIDFTNAAGGTVTVDGDGASRMFNIDGTDVTFSNMTLINGQATTDPAVVDSGLGGAIYTSGGADLTITDSFIGFNDADELGGAIYARQGSLTITDSVIEGNDALDGGGIYTSFASTTITSSTLRANDASRDGGALFAQGGGFGDQFLVDRTEAVDNTANGDGGAIYNENGTFVVTASTFSGNDGNRGGAAFNDGSLEFNNSTVSDNEANQGGGLYNDRTLTVTNSTLTQNEVDQDNGGGGIKTSVGQTTHVFNTIVAGNTATAGDIPDDLAVSGTSENVSNISSNNIVGDADSAAGLADGVLNNIVGELGVGTLVTDEVIDPLLFDNGGPTRTHKLIKDGLGEDAGDDNRAAFAGLDLIPDVDGDGDTALTFDQRGEAPYARIFGDTVDIGAFEIQPLLVNNSGNAVDGNFSDGQFSLAEAIAVANASAGADEIAFNLDIESLVIELDEQLPIITDITIDGTNFADRGGYITLDGLGEGRLFWVQDTTFGLRNITLTNGHADGSDEDTTDLNGNDLDFAGGAILNQGGVVTLDRTGITSSQADSSGGALYTTDGGEHLIYNTTLSNNSATLRGGAVASLSAGRWSVVSSTITDNTAGIDGGGIYDQNPVESFAFNSIIAGNEASGIPLDFTGTPLNPISSNNLVGSSASAGGLTHGVNGNIVGNAGLGNLDVSTVLEPRRDNAGAHETYGLTENSPALNAGDNDRAAFAGADFIPSVAAGDDPLESDARTFPFQRIFDGTVDIGAYETQILTLNVSLSEDENDADFSDGDFALREAVRFSNLNPEVDIIRFNLADDPTVFVDTQLEITNSVVVDGSNLSGDEVVIDGLGENRLFLVNAVDAPVTAQFSNITFSNGNADGSDGGLTPESGGAILSRFGRVELQNTSFRNNQAADGGGAIYNEDGVLILHQSTVDSNSAAVFGGGIVNDDGTIEIFESTISNNDAAVDGGGIFNNNGPLSIVNSTVSGNEANVDAGGIYNEDNTVVIVNTTIVNNIADADGNGTGSGGGMLTVDDAVTFTNLFNNIIAGNETGTGTPADLAGKTPEAISSNNLIGDANSAVGLVDGANGHIVGIDGAGTIPLSSILNPALTNNGGPVETHALAVDSPAIDGGDSNRAALPGDNLIPDIAGDGDTAVVFDQRGFPFVRAFVDVDMGSYEVTRGWVVDSVADNDNGDYSAGDLTLREAISLANSTPATVEITFDLATPAITISGDQLEVDSNIIIDGTNTNAAGGTVELTSTNGRLFHLDGLSGPASLGLLNLTLTGGDANGTDPAPFQFEGGAILNESGDLLLDNVVLDNNRAGLDGGAIMSRSGSLTIMNSLLTNNEASNDGGAVFSFGATTEIHDTNFTGNTASNRAGALLARAGTVNVGTSTFNNNDAVFGGVAATEINANLYVTNSTVSANSATADGGAFYNTSGFTVLTNTTVTGNRADSDGNGVGVGGGVWTGTSGGTRLFNTIVAGNDVVDPVVPGATLPNDLDGANVIAASSNNLIGNTATAGGLIDGSGGNIVGNGGSGTLPIGSILTTVLASNGGSATQTHALVPGSPAIEAGNTNRAAFPGSNGIPDQGGDGDIGLVFDQRGTPFGRATGTVDIGAYEVTSDWSVDSGGDSNDGDFTNGNFSLREAIETANASPGTDTITFDIGLSRSTIELSGELVVTEDLVINGLGAGSLTIDALGLSRVLHVMPGVTVSVSNLTLTGGNTAGSGGAILNQGTLTITDSALRNNQAAIGGAIMNEGIINVSRTEISGNTAQYGAGIASDASQLNSQLDNVTISNNQATGANGVFAGAGLYIADSTFTVINSTIAFNTSDVNAEGAGIAVDPVIAGQEGTLNLINSIVADNVTTGTGVDVAGDIARLNHSLTSVNAGYTRVDEGGNAEGFAALLEPLDIYNGQTATHQLSRNSPAVNTGNNAEAFGAFDQTRQPRQSGTVDMGADERLIRAVDDSALAVAGNDIVIPVLNNDSPTSNVEIRSVTSGTLGSTAITGPDVTYSSNGTTGIDSFTYEIGTATQKQTGQTDAELGQSVDVDGDWMVTGSWLDDTGNADAGAAVVFRRVGSSWIQHQVLTAADADPRDQFGWDVAIEGTTIVVGARKDDDSGEDAGAAYVYELDASQDLWINSAKLVDVEGADKDQFGHSVDIDGDTIIIGARLADGMGTNGGSVFVFNRADGWSASTELKPTDQVRGDQFGFDVSLDGSVLAVGARKDNSGGVDSGSVYVWENFNGTWQEVREITASNTRRNNWFGYSVALDNGTLAIGMPQRFSRFRTGEVHIHEMNAGGADNWGETALLVDPGVDPETDRFGFSVAIEGDDLLIGATRDDTIANNAGMVYQHGRDAGGAGTWGLVQPLPGFDTRQNDSYGRSLAIDGDTIAIGAPLVDVGTSLRNGAIYISDTRSDFATVTVTVASPLQAAVQGPGTTDELTVEELAPIVDAAREYWLNTQLTSSQVASLQAATFSVAHLNGFLGLEIGGNITLDADAEGHGWYVDPTPFDQSDDNIGNRMDLLTAVTHELGHVVGLADQYDPSQSVNLMYGFLNAGERRMDLNAADTLFSAISFETELADELF